MRTDLLNLGPCLAREATRMDAHLDLVSPPPLAIKDVVAPAIKQSVHHPCASDRVQRDASSSPSAAALGLGLMPGSFFCPLGALDDHVFEDLHLSVEDRNLVLFRRIA